MGTYASKKKKSKEIQGQTVIKYPAAKFKTPSKNNLGILSTLPNDLMTEIAKYLKDSEILSFSIVCKAIYLRLLEPKFWIDLSKMRKSVYFEDDYKDMKYCHAKCWYFYNLKTQVNEITYPHAYVPERRQVTVVGARGVGKTSLLNCLLTRKSFSETYSPSTRVEYTESYWVRNNHMSRIFMWDTVEDDNPAYCGYDSQVHLILYSVTDRTSFDSIEKLYSIASAEKSLRAITIVLVSTKNDLPETEHTVKSSEGKQWADERQIPFVESSAKTSQGLQHIRKLIMQSTGERNTD